MCIARVDDESVKPHVSSELIVVDEIGLELCSAHGFKPRLPRWSHCFKNIDAMAFVTQLPDSYTPEEKPLVLADVLADSASYHSFCSGALIEGSSCLLFLRKPDKFLEKVLKYGMSGNKPPEYYLSRGLGGDRAALSSLIRRFKRSVYDDAYRDSFAHVMSSKEISATEFVKDSIKTILMTENLRRSGFLGAPMPDPEGSGSDLSRNGFDADEKTVVSEITCVDPILGRELVFEVELAS